MKHHRWIFLLAGWVAVLSADGAEPPYIALYRGDRSGAVSLTFDDGFREEVEDAVAILDPFGIKGTFFIMPLIMEANPDRFVSWDRVKTLIGSGHEIGTHGSIKEKLHEAAPDRLDVLINRSHDLILKHTGYDPVAYAAPGGSKVGEREASVILQQHEFIRHRNYLPHARIIGYGNTDRRQWSDEATRELITEEAKAHHWVIAYIHSIVGGYSPFKSRDEFKAHCAWLASQQEALWIAPMGEVGRYLRARENARLQIMSATDQSLRFKLSTSAPDPTPLTVVIPATATSVDVDFRSGQIASAPTIRADAIVLDVIPSDAEILVRWK